MYKLFAEADHPWCVSKTCSIKTYVLRTAFIATACWSTVSASYAGDIPTKATDTTNEVQSQPTTDVVVADNTDTSTSAASSNAPMEIEIKAQRLDRARNGISTDTGSSVYHLSQKDIEKQPLGDNTSFNQVLLQAPGVVQDSFGQLHIRGDHADVQYRINGVILPESISGFGQTLDTAFMQSVNLLTGALPAQYGYRTAGIVDIQTKTGTFDNGGRIGVMAGSNNTREASGEVSGSDGNFNYFVNGSILSNNLGIENPTPSQNAIHDTTDQSKGFGYFSYLLNDTSRINLILGSSDNHFQIPNQTGQTTNFPLNGYAAYSSADLNERQHEITDYEVLAFQGSAGDNLDYQLATFSRYTKVMFDPDVPGDLMFTGVASQVLRTGVDNGLQADGSYTLNDNHTLRLGTFYSQERLTNADTSLTFPANNLGTQMSTTPIGFTDNDSKIAYLEGIYLQDEWKALDKLTINYGARYDEVNAYVTGEQLSPRLGAIYQLTAQDTLHAGYARYFTPPPMELISAYTVAAFQNTTNAPLSNLNDPVKPEVDDYYDLGLSHKVDAHLTLGVDSYYKKAKDLLDEGQFGSALLFTPFNYAEGEISGIELTANYQRDNFSSYVNLARSTALGKQIVSSQYNFAPDELAYINDHWIHLDHDQKLTASTGASYLWNRTTYAADALFGSGLRSGFANTDHLSAYTQINVSATHQFITDELGKIEGRFTIVNLFDNSYEIRDGTGVGVGAPQFDQRRSFYVGIDKLF